MNVFVEQGRTAAGAAVAMQACKAHSHKLRMISSHGMPVSPDGFAQTVLCDSWPGRSRAWPGLSDDGPRAEVNAGGQTSQPLRYSRPTSAVASARLASSVAAFQSNSP
jgi:hypothetical protein